jgi:hypothetical protein
MTNQELFKQAIADAKSVRDAAVANAKAALEETFTPSIMNMLSNKLNEMEDDMEKKEGMKEKEEGYGMEEAKGGPQIIVPANDANDLDEEAEYFQEMLQDAGIMARVEAGIGELEIYLTNSMDKRKAEKAISDAGYTMGYNEGMKEKEEGYSMEEMNLEEILAELEKEEGKMKEGEKKEVEEAKKTEEKGKKKVEEAEDKETMEEAEGDDEITELTVDELKDIIRDVLQDIMGGTEEEAGEEEVEAGEEESEEGEDEESISLDELLAELDEIEEGKDKEKVEEKKEEDEKKVEEAKKEANKAKRDLEEAIKVIKFLKKELNEVNLLNAKNTYVNKIFKAKSLSESQKVNVLKSIDNATNVKEAKVIYESLISTLSTTRKNTIKESVGFASKAMGVAPKQPIVEGDAAIRRMQQLAGIIK